MLGIEVLVVGVIVEVSGVVVGGNTLLSVAGEAVGID